MNMSYKCNPTIIHDCTCAWSKKKNHDPCPINEMHLIIHDCTCQKKQSNLHSRMYLSYKCKTAYIHDSTVLYKQRPRMYLSNKCNTTCIHDCIRDSLTTSMTLPVPWMHYSLHRTRAWLTTSMTKHVPDWKHLRLYLSYQCNYLAKTVWSLWLFRFGWKAKSLLKKIMISIKAANGKKRW